MLRERPPVRTICVMLARRYAGSTVLGPVARRLHAGASGVTDGPARRLRASIRRDRRSGGMSGRTGVSGSGRTRWRGGRCSSHAPTAGTGFRRRARARAGPVPAVVLGGAPDRYGGRSQPGRSPTQSRALRARIFPCPYRRKECWGSGAGARGTGGGRDFWAMSYAAQAKSYSSLVSTENLVHPHSQAGSSPWRAAR